MSKLLLIRLYLYNFILFFVIMHITLYICINYFLSILFSLGTTRSLRPLSPSSESKILCLLQRMQTHYRYRGINLRTCYEDFDRHHMGVVTESQVGFFYKYIEFSLIQTPPFPRQLSV